MKKTYLLLLVGMMVFGNAMSVNAKVPALHLNDPKETESTDTTEDLYQIAENEIFSIELPKEWTVEYIVYDISAGKTGTDEMPIIEVTPTTISNTVEEELASWSDYVKEKFQQRLAGEPERVTYSVPGTERVIEGIRFSVSSEDGMDTYTEYLTVEEIDGIAMSYFCGYLSGSYDDNKHEDQTTYFEFLHTIDSMCLK